MSASSLPGPVPVPRRWWPNPIFRRYLRSRLRPQALIASLLITVIIAGFLYFSFRTGFRFRGEMTIADAERATLVPLLVLQSLILFFMGTGSVTAGITAEADEGTMEYQRLSPLTPLTKVFGYLLGLPVREWMLFAATLPFTAWALWKGEVEAASWLPIYTALISAALLYHLTGLVMGTVVKNRRWAFLLSLTGIMVLYTLIPQAAKFGLVYFKYLTIWPVVDENIIGLMPREASGLMRMAQSLEPDVRFFGLQFSELVFTLFSQSVLSLTFVMMLWRRWRRAESHLLGKVWAGVLFAWTQVMLLGNALPLIAPGLLFPSRQFNRRFMLINADWRPSIMEALSMIALYGMVTLLLLVVLTMIITPTADYQIRGLRRARKLGLKNVPRWGDSSSSFGVVTFMAVAGAVGWSMFASEMITSHWFAGHALSPWTGAIFGVVLLSAGWAFQSLLEGWGGQRVFLAIVFFAVLPPMAGAVIGGASNQFLTPAIWLVGMSPALAPGFAAATTLPTVDLPNEVARAIPRAFGFWQTMTAVISIWLLIRVRSIRAARRRSVFAPDAGNPAEGA